MVPIVSVSRNQLIQQLCQVLDAVVVKVTKKQEDQENVQEN